MNFVCGPRFNCFGDCFNFSALQVPFQSIQCPESARPPYPDGSCWFPQTKPTISYYWDELCKWGMRGCWADGVAWQELSTIMKENDSTISSFGIRSAVWKAVMLAVEQWKNFKKNESSSFQKYLWCIVNIVVSALKLANPSAILAIIKMPFFSAWMWW